MVEVYLVRHGESEHNRDGIIQGQIDSSLTGRGEEQAGKLAEALENEGFDAVYSSDLERARETAKILNRYHGLEVVETEKLRERNLGVLEGSHYTEWAEVEKENHHGWKPENGESLREHKQRTLEVLEELVDRDLGKVLIVTHGGAIRAALAAILDCKSREVWRIELDNCSLTELRYSKDGWTIKAVNSMIHEY